MSERNSDPPLKSPDQVQADANIPRRRVSAGSEMDLWNLDDELPTAKELPSADSSAPDDESIVRVEKGTINRAKISTKVAKPKLAKEISPQEPRKARREPEEPAPAPITAPKSTPKGVVMLEDEIWADFDHDDAPAAPALIEEPPAAEEAPAAVLQPDTYRTEPLELPPVTEQSPPEPEPIISKILSSEAPVESNLPDESLPADDSAPAAQSLQITKFSRLEVIASLVFLALLIGAGAFGIHLFKANVQTQVDPFATPDFPINGAIAHVKEVTTYWRAPIKEGANPDTTQRDVTLIPVIDITLDEKKSESGVLRVMFYNEAGEITGDIITREFKNHRFVQNGQSTQSFASTSGFSDFGEQQAYRASLNNPWTIRVYEGPNAAAPSSSFLLLFSTPISTNRK